ncbi:MAG: phosphate acyltransferase PlsX [Phycisphaerae bacterium]|nr:phosphate acyltransferase PlsX [Phycisphaerae bacterium]
MRIAVDAMGGDHAPAEIVKGAIEGLGVTTDAEVVLVGREDAIRTELEKYDGWQGRVQIVHASEVIEMDESPIDGVRRKKDSSIVRMAKLAEAGEVQACISAGNTGACAGACQLKMKKLPGIKRAGIAVILPTFHGWLVMCDVGANISPRSDHLYQYGVMASVYSRVILGVENPRVGIISIGEEDIKGTDLVKAAAELLKAEPQVNFVGNVEGRDLFNGTVDVVVSDGFVGNVVLKMVESVAEGLIRTIGQELAREAPDIMHRFKPVVQRIWERYDYSEHGGAPLLGVNGVCIICHGSSDARAIRNAVRVAERYIHKNLNATISEAIARSHEVTA